MIIINHHGNFKGKSRVTRCENSKSHITLLSPFTPCGQFGPDHASRWYCLGPITRHGKPLCHPGKKHKQNNNSARASHFLVQYNFWPSLHNYDPKFPYFFSWTWHPVYPRSIACPPPTSLGWPYTPEIAVSRGLTVSSNVLSMRLNLLLLVMLLKKRIVLSISHLLHPRCNVRITCPVRGGKQEDCFGTSRVGRSPMTHAHEH